MMSMCSSHATACTRRKAAKTVSSKGTTVSRGNIEGKQIIIVDDVLTSGQSMADYKEEIERCGGKVVAAIFYGKTVTRPPLLLIKAHVWGGCIVNKIKELTK